MTIPYRCPLCGYERESWGLCPFCKVRMDLPKEEVNAAIRAHNRNVVQMVNEAINQPPSGEEG